MCHRPFDAVGNHQLAGTSMVSVSRASGEAEALKYL